jgi:hypothetical protein
MTLQNLNKIIDRYEAEIGISKNEEKFELLKELPFYCQWPSSTNNNIKSFNKIFCCFNHAINLPTKDGYSYPLFDYELLLFNALSENKYLWVKKASGLGITEFVLRYMAWLATKDNTYTNTQFPIITGPNQDIAIKLVKRIRLMFDNLGIYFNTKETVVELNSCTIEAFPSNHLDAYRSLVAPKFIFIDEGDFFRESDQPDVRSVSERYIAKSNPWIVMVSTPNAPGQLFEQIEREPSDSCLYHRIFLDYTWGLGKVYTHQEITKAKTSPSFEREYNLKYLGSIGNLIPYQDVDACTEDYPLPTAGNAFKAQGTWFGIDPAFSSSQFAICIVQWRDDKLNVVYTEMLDKPLYTDALQLIRSLIQKYTPCKVFIDGSAAHLIHELKHGYDEYINYESIDPEILRSFISSSCREPLIVPVNFQQMHKEMAKHTVKVMAHRRVRIHPQFDKLITALKSATTKDDEFTLDKPKSAFNDLFDSFRLALLCLHSTGEF